MSFKEKEYQLAKKKQNFFKFFINNSSQHIFEVAKISLKEHFLLKIKKFELLYK